MKKTVTVALLSLCMLACNAEKRVEKFEPTWDSLAKVKPAKWWDEGKFGIFIHWGPYSVAGYKYNNIGYAEAITEHMYQSPEKYKSFFMEKFGAYPPEFGYKDWIPYYTAENWNPEEWAKLFKKIGAKYVILTAEHHDGFANWDSKLTDWNSVKMGPKRDLVGDLGKAVRNEGLAYGLSYHRERHPSRFTGKFKAHNKPFPLIAEEIKREPKCEELYGPFSYSDEFIKDYVDRWKEINKLYKPDFMWIDDVPLFYKDPDDPQTKKFEEAFKYMIADYVNEAYEQGRDVYFNNKGKILNFPLGVGCAESDNMRQEKIFEYRWQNPATMGVSFAYMHNEEVNDLYKSPAELVRLLVDVVSKNGNLLLNIGPRADGTIPEGMQKRLLAMGKWVNANGECIYGTKSWKVFGEYKGEIIKEEDVHYNKHSMRIHEKEYRYISKGNVVYVISFQKENEPFILESFKEFENSIDKVTYIDNSPLSYKFTEQGLEISDEKSDFYLAKVYKVFFK